MTIKISIFIPLYNGAETVGRAVESVLAQDYPHWEAVIGDNASKDDPGLILRRYADPRIRYHRWPTHVSMTENFNRTAELCSYGWIQQLSADDSLHLDCLQVVAARIAEHDDPDHRLALVMAAARRLHADGREVGREHFGVWGAPAHDLSDGTYSADDWLRRFPPACEGRERAMTVSRRVLAGTGYYHPDAEHFYGDVELALRAAAFGDIAYIANPLSDVTTDAGSHTAGWLARDLAGAPRATYIEKSLRAGLLAHERIGTVSPAVKRAMAAVAARSHLRRASAHRFAPAGRGRGEAAADIGRAIRLDPRTAFAPLTVLYWLDVLLAPKPIHRWLRRAAINLTSSTREDPLGTERGPE